jgi:hypothetical protein
MNEAAFDAATGEEGREDLRVMIAAGVAIDLGAAAELGAEHDERGGEEATLGEVFEERGKGHIEFRARALRGLPRCCCACPSRLWRLRCSECLSRRGDGRAGSPGRICCRRIFPQGVGFVIEAEGFEVGAGHDGDGFLVELGVALHAGGLKTLAEARVELVEHGEALLHHVGTGVALANIANRPRDRGWAAASSWRGRSRCPHSGWRFTHTLEGRVLWLAPRKFCAQAPMLGCWMVPRCS